MNKSENRVGKKPVPKDVLQYMNPDQLLTYRGMQAFGWHLKFVRRPLFQRPVFVMTRPDSEELAVIEENGEFNREHDIPLRNSATLERAGHKLSFAPA